MAMARLPMPLTLPLWVLILSALSTPLVSAVPASLLFARQSTCPTDAFKCANSSFCCSNGNTCVSLAGDTTVLCCPEGSSCSKIETITCNVDELNPENNPDAPVKTTVFDVALEKCGDKCCPFGYSCTGNKACEKNQDQSQPPKGHSTTTSTSTSTKTSTTRSTGVPTTQPSTTGSSATTSTRAPVSSATNDESAGGKPQSYGPDVGSIVGGVVGGCAVLLIAAVVIFICVRRRARNNPGSSEKQRSTGSGFSGIISDPIVQPNSYRTDFILRPPSSSPGTEHRQSIPCIAEERLFRRSRKSFRRSIRNPFNSPSPSYVGSVSRASSVSSEDSPPRRGQVGARLAPIRQLKVYSQHLKPQQISVHRQPSAESIDVFADPKTVDDSFNRQTTFTDLMGEADLEGVGKNKPYVLGTTPHVPGTTPRI